MKTIVENKTTSITSDNIRVTIEEDDERVFISVSEKRRTATGDYDSTEEIITSNLSIVKARELSLMIID